MIRNILLIIVIVLTATACRQNDTAPSKVSNGKRETLLDTNTDSIINDTRDQIIVVNKDEIFNKYYKELIDSLSQNGIPYFLYEECLDVERASYTYVNSHHSISLRYDLLRKLSNSQLKFILKNATFTLLKAKCKSPVSQEKYMGDKSNYDLIVAILKEQKFTK